MYCCSQLIIGYSLSFFFNDTATTEIYTLSLHDALPIWAARHRKNAMVINIGWGVGLGLVLNGELFRGQNGLDRKSTRLNSSHANISYAVFCLKKKIP